MTLIAFEIVGFIVLSLLYLAFSNRYITQGYIVNKLEAERKQLIIQTEVTNRLTEQAKSLANVEEYAGQNMMRVAKVEFIEPHDGTVAILSGR